MPYWDCHPLDGMAGPDEAKPPVRVSFVIPCYRSAHSLPDVVHTLESVYGGKELPYEIVLVNDCSPDDTFGVIKELASKNPCVTGVSLSKNFGQHAAIMAGLRHATGDVVVCMDDDGQTPPEEAHKLIAQVLAGHDVAIARYADKKHNSFRNLGSKINNSMAKMMIGKPKELYLSSFVAMKRYIAEEICSYTFPYPYISGLLIRATNDIVNVDVEHKERESGESGYTVRKLMALWFNGFTNFSIKPLRAATIIGAIIALIGFIYGIYAIVTKLVNPDVPLGWASTTAAVVFIGGLILIVLGLIGEYVGRMFMGMNQSPQYVVKEVVNPHNKES